MKHTVVGSQTFGSLAFQYYGDSLKHRELREANPQILSSEISPGDILEIPDLPTPSSATLQHPEISFNSRGGGSLQTSPQNIELQIDPWNNYTAYLRRVNQLPEEVRTQ